MYIMKLNPSIPIFGTKDGFTVRFKSVIELVHWLMIPANYMYIDSIESLEYRP